MCMNCNCNECRCDEEPEPTNPFSNEEKWMKDQNDKVWKSILDGLTNPKVHATVIERNMNNTT